MIDGSQTQDAVALWHSSTARAWLPCCGARQAPIFALQAVIVAWSPCFGARQAAIFAYQAAIVAWLPYCGDLQVPFAVCLPGPA